MSFCFRNPTMYTDFLCIHRNVGTDHSKKSEKLEHWKVCVTNLGRRVSAVLNSSCKLQPLEMPSCWGQPQGQSLIPLGHRIHMVVRPTSESHASDLNRSVIVK